MLHSGPVKRLENRESQRRSLGFWSVLLNSGGWLRTLHQLKDPTRHRITSFRLLTVNQVSHDLRTRARGQVGRWQRIG